MARTYLAMCLAVSKYRHTHSFCCKILAAYTAEIPAGVAL